MPTEPELLSVAEVSKRFRVAHSTVLRWAKRRDVDLDEIRVGNTVRFRADQIEALIRGEKAS